MARMTRAESQAQTRARIVAAARMAFAAKGFYATTVEQIVEAAGYTKGAFYSNFPSKEALGLEITKADAGDKVDLLVNAIGDRIGGGTDAVLDVLRSASNVTSGLEDERLRLELLLHGYHMPEVGSALREQLLANRASFRNAIGFMFSAFGRGLPIDAMELANFALILHYGRKVLEIAGVPHDAGAITEAIFRALIENAPPTSR